MGGAEGGVGGFLGEASPLVFKGVEARGLGGGGGVLRAVLRMVLRDGRWVVVHVVVVAGIGGHLAHVSGLEFGRWREGWSGGIGGRRRWEVCVNRGNLGGSKCKYTLFIVAVVFGGVCGGVSQVFVETPPRVLMCDLKSFP